MQNLLLCLITLKTILLLTLSCKYLDNLKCTRVNVKVLQLSSSLFNNT